MGGRAGGGARGAAGGGGSNPWSRQNIVLKGGFQGNNSELSYLSIKSIDKQTDKAVQVTTSVNWNWGTSRDKQIWVPKSTISAINKSNQMAVKSTMLDSISSQNTFKGYKMNFSNVVNASQFK